MLYGAYFFANHIKRIFNCRSTHTKKQNQKRTQFRFFQLFSMKDAQLGLKLAYSTINYLITVCLKKKKEKGTTRYRSTTDAEQFDHFLIKNQNNDSEDAVWT